MVVWFRSIRGGPSLLVDSKTQEFAHRSNANNDKNACVVRYASLLKQCKSLRQGKSLHEQILTDGWGHVIFLRNLLVEMYGRCGSPRDALSVFWGIAKPNLVSWTLAITASSQNGDFHKALELVRRMLLSGMKLDEVAFLAVLNSCSAMDDAQEIHAWIVESGYGSNFFLCNALINIFSKLGDLYGVERVFHSMHQKDVISWTSMVSAYAANGRSLQVRKMLWRMDLEGVKPNFVTFLTLVEACTQFEDLDYGRLTHSRIKGCGYDSVVIVCNSLIHMYAKLSDLPSSIDVFRGMKEKNIVSWTAMLAAYAQSGSSDEAMKLFRYMDVEGIKTDVVALVAISGSVSILTRALEIHARAAEYLDSNVPLGNALITMYGKCGSVEDARKTFESMKVRNVVSWSSIVGVCAQDGRGREAVELFKSMILDGICPNESSCVSMLFATTHEGDVHDCRDFFVSIERDFGFVPTVDHYAGLVDLLGRAGAIKGAKELIDTMPYFPDSIVYLTLLSACFVHNDLEHGRAAASQVLELDPSEESSYILFSNINAFLQVT